MVQFQHWIYCADCEIYMELGEFDYDNWRFRGPLLPLENRRTESDWALRMFLEQHTGHRLGIESDVKVNFEKSAIAFDWKLVEPLDALCMIFKDTEELMELVEFPQKIEKVLFIVDVYDWAWDIASRELLNHWTEVEGEIISIREFVLKQISTDEYDVIFVYPWGSKALMDMLDARKTVVYIAGGAQGLRKKSLNRTCKRFKFFGTKNRQLMEDIRQWYPRRKTVMLTTGIDTELFKPKPIPHEGFRVGWAGSIHRDIKRFNLAKKICAEANVGLNVAGYKDQPGHREHKEMPAFYNSNDCHLVTSTMEAHPLIAYESMACEVPIIATRVGDVEDVIMHGGNGFIVDVNAPSRDYVYYINLLKDDPELRKTMGESARLSVIEHFSWSSIAELYRQLPHTMNR